VGGWVITQTPGDTLLPKPRGKARDCANLGGLGRRLIATVVRIILNGVQLGSLRLRGPGRRRWTSGHMGVGWIKRCVHLSGRQRPELPALRRGVDNP
jgi:hypothetical protein